MNQKTINDIYYNVALLAEKIAEALYDDASKLEDENNKDSFKKAQSFKTTANELSIEANKMKNKYPHLFKD